MPAFRKLTVNLMVEDVLDTLAFYTSVLGFTAFSQVPDAHDPALVQFAMMGRDTVVIMLQSRRSLTEDVPTLAGVPIGASATLFIDVEDVTALVAALEGKAEIVVPMHDTWYDTREVYFKDLNGYILCLAETLKKDTPADA